jgi:hypothetical protein
MDKKTKIIIGVGVLAIAGWWLYNNKSTMHLPKLPTTKTSSSTTPNGKCPAGKKLTTVQCIKAPCPQACV